MFADLIQPTHLLLLFGVVLLILGPKKLPEVGRSLGKSIHGFKEAISGDDAGLLTMSETSEGFDEAEGDGSHGPVLAASNATIV